MEVIFGLAYKTQPVITLAGNGLMAVHILMTTGILLVGSQIKYKSSVGFSILINSMNLAVLVTGNGEITTALIVHIATFAKNES